MIHISTRTRNTPASPIRRLSSIANEARKKGTQLIPLNIGQPDLLCPESFIDGLKQACNRMVAYAPSEGIPEFREEWAKWVNKQVGVDTKPEEYIVTMGASEGLVFLFTSICDPNDEIIVFDPTYANYLGFAAQSGVRLVSLLSQLEDGFALPGDDVIQKHITSHTRAILFCNPNNPTGVAYSKDEVRRLLNICHTYGLYLIMDETYREIIYDDFGVQTALSIAANDPHVVVVDSMSKRFSLCGARLGTLHIPNEDLREKILHLAQARLAAPTLAQHACTYMLQNLPDDFLDTVRATYQSRRDALFESVNAIPDVKPILPSGAFYLLAKLPVKDADDFARYLLADFTHKDHSVFIAPARGFYSVQGVGKNEVRLAFVLEEEKLQFAGECLAEALKQYPN